MVKKMRPATPEERNADMKKRYDQLYVANKMGLISGAEFEKRTSALEDFGGYPREVEGVKCRRYRRPVRRGLRAGSAIRQTRDHQMQVAAFGGHTCHMFWVDETHAFAPDN